MQTALVCLGLVRLFAQAAAAAPSPPAPEQPQLQQQQAPEQQQQRRPPEQGEPGASSSARATVETTSEPPKKQDDDDPDKSFTLSGYVETFYQYNFNRPGNGVTNGRGYDVRHNTITLQNAVLDAGFRAKKLMGRLALQTGLTPATYYAQEPVLSGADAAGDSTPQLWQYLQRASVGWEATDELLLEAGLFTTSFGLESIAVKDNWNWSRSNATVRLPTYVSGVKTTLHASRRIDLVSGIVNGWNRVVDDNDEKTLFGSFIYKARDDFTASLSYYGGVEREGGAAEGRAWRHGTEAFAQLDATEEIQLAAHAAAGIETTHFGAHRWIGGAGLGRVKATKVLYFAARLDALAEDPAANALGESRPFLVDGGSVVSETGTVDVHPVEGLSTRLEFRHDGADAEMFFRGEGRARYQNTVLVGLTGWF